ncbi:MAG: hypothetical protein ABIP69_00065 [Ferruginibacter sp.]
MNKGSTHKVQRKYNNHRAQRDVAIQRTILKISLKIAEEFLTKKPPLQVPGGPIQLFPLREAFICRRQIFILSLAKHKTTLRQFYISRIEELQIQLKKLKNKKSALGWLRLGPMLLLGAAFYFLMGIGLIYVFIAAVILIFIFIKLINADLDNQLVIDKTKLLLAINENEIKLLDGDFLNFEDGSRFAPKEHNYANDLDIFGRASLFQYVNRTASDVGGKQLADFLLTPSKIEKISLQQEAIDELSKKVLFLQNLIAIGKVEKISFSAKQKLEDWISEPLIFSKYKALSWLRYLLPAIVLTITVLFIFDYVSSTIFYSTLLVFALISYQINKIIAPIHNELSKISGELNSFSKSISLIENEKFSSVLLKDLQNNFVSEDIKVSSQILGLRKILDRLDLRYNLVMSFPLNILLLWSLQQALDLEKWKSKQQIQLNKWFDTLAAFEALGSFGILNFNNPEWCFAKINPDYFSISGTEIGHPLILESKRVNNYIDIKDNNTLMIVTGSNMAGKSTYLRSIGINVVLAMAGSPVCAKEFEVSYVELISSMRITDNLEENTSTFYAELKKLKLIIEKVNSGNKVFILLDEILRGTNSLDRHIGSVALIKQLIRKKAAAVIATHDLELAELKKSYNQDISNYNFDVQVNNSGELYFDYLLRSGVCTSLNASILMKQIGIELDEMLG